MYSPKDLHQYQRTAILHQSNNFSSMLWIDMGLGKTIITLTSIDYWMRANKVDKVLIFGPLRVIHAVWEEEARKWSHVGHLRFQVIHGSEKKRESRLFNPNADIYLINYENMAWLAGMLDYYYISQNKNLPFQAVVYDEVTKIKKANTQRMAGGKRYLKSNSTMNLITTEHGFFVNNHGLQSGDRLIFNNPIDGLNQGVTYFPKHRSKDKFSLHEGIKSSPISIPDTMFHGDVMIEKETDIIGWRKIMDHFQYRTGLTGTPAPNGYEDLHGQFLAIDGGQRLGEFVTHFRDNYMVKNFNGFGHTITSHGVGQIEARIQDITIKMDAKDHLTLPETVVNDIMLELPSKVRVQYDELEKELFVALDSDNEIEVFNRGSLSNKCLQFANGSPYLNPNEPEWYELHDIKLRALEEVLEEAGGSPVLTGYSFKPDAERIMKKFKRFNPVNITGTKAKDLPKILKAIKNGEHQLIVGHPQSMGHGIDGLQDVCHIAVKFGLNWNLEYDQQLTGRIIRQGQQHTTVVHRLLCIDTMDEVVRDSLMLKNTNQESLKQSIQDYRDRR